MLWQIFFVTFFFGCSLASESKELNPEEVCEFLKSRNAWLAGMHCPGMTEDMLNAIIKYFNDQGLNIINPKDSSNGPSPQDFTDLRSTVEKIIASMPPVRSYTSTVLEQLRESSLFGGNSAHSPPVATLDGKAPYLSNEFLAALFSDA